MVWELIWCVMSKQIVDFKTKNKTVYTIENCYDLKTDANSEIKGENRRQVNYQWVFTLKIIL